MTKIIMVNDEITTYLRARYCEVVLEIGFDRTMKSPVPVDAIMNRLEEYGEGKNIVIVPSFDFISINASSRKVDTVNDYTFWRTIRRDILEILNEYDPDRECIFSILLLVSKINLDAKRRKP